MNIIDNAICNNKEYLSMLALMARLSNLFSESQIPFIHYRVTENLFCKYMSATNLSRTDTAYDAKLGELGIGIKTFILPGRSSLEKIAEFNALSHILRNLDGYELANKLAEFRNERMKVANDLYGIKSSLYHIIGRRKQALYVFNSPYDFIDKQDIKVLKSTDKSLHFTDGKNKYSFNRSKTVLLKEFEMPPDANKIKVEIIEDPFSLLETLLMKVGYMEIEAPKEQILLPLFSLKDGIKYVPKKSGLNQWNALGRKRDENEVYIPIPASVHREKAGFFPDRNTIFTLLLPDGTEMSAKVCQDGNKALMSNPNKALGEWLLRKVLHKQPYHLITYQDLVIAGFDSLVLTKENEKLYKLNVSRDISFTY